MEKHLIIGLKIWTKFFKDAKRRTWYLIGKNATLWSEKALVWDTVCERGIEVDKAKIEVIEQLPPPVNIKGIRSFQGHAGFYR